MHILTAAFLTSAAEPAGWPRAACPEIAFCGRSNVGKSTLLNALLGRGLARVSQTPGRTRLINFFRLQTSVVGDVPLDLLLVDLPGFGYARVSRAQRATWRPLIQRYLEERASLRAVILLCDARRALAQRQDPTLLQEEADLGRWLREDVGRVVLPVLTKSDKLSKHERKPAADLLRRRLGATPVIFSSLTGEGVDELWRRLATALAAETRSAGARVIA